MMYTFRTSPPINYISPSAEEMKEEANKVGLKSFSRDLVADLCNIAAGGKTNLPSAYRDRIWNKVEDSLPAPDSDGDWKLDKEINGSGYTKDRLTAINDRVAKEMRYHQNVCDFLQIVDLSKFPGQTPLQQAMSLLKLLSLQKGGQGGGEAGEPLPIFQESECPETVGDKLHDLMDQVDSLSQEEQDMLDPEGEKHAIEKSLEGDGERTGGKPLDKLKVAEDLVEGSNKRIMLDISRKLDLFSKMQVRKQKLVKQDPAGDEVRQRPIKNLSELHKVSKQSWAVRQESPTYFLYKAISGQLLVRERVTRIEKKQAILILFDGTGSMRGTKHWKASGVAMNRLKAVVSGDAEVWLCVFDTELKKMHHAATPEEARKIIKEFMAQNYTGGGTDIANSIRAAHKFIKEKIEKGEALYHPEIVVLTDEDTSVKGLAKNEIPGTRVHGFAMEVANHSLVEFAKSTGGVGIDKF